MSRAAALAGTAPGVLYMEDVTWTECPTERERRLLANLRRHQAHLPPKLRSRRPGQFLRLPAVACGCLVDPYARDETGTWRFALVWRIVRPRCDAHRAADLVGRPA